MNRNAEQTGYIPIENYGIVGNLHTAGLISNHASVDFMCFPRFDSPTVFCKLLDATKGGSFVITPLMEDVVVKQLYLPDTNVLVTRFLADEGIAEIIDFMPPSESESNFQLIRIVLTVRGNVTYEMSCAPRFDYARAKHTIQKREDYFVFCPENKSQPSLRLRADIQLSTEHEDLICKFTLKESESASIVLEADVEEIKDKAWNNLHAEAQSIYQETIKYWQQWISKSTYRGRWQEVVNRSALTLKLLTSRRYGSIIAAPTFSLPESIGNSRNWDYRYTWIRDAAFSLHAFLQLGFKDEAAAFLKWIQDQSTDKELQLMFSIDGKTELTEIELDHLEGYRQSKPVRIGNEAHKQVQLDIYGELLETIYIYSEHNGDLTYDFWNIIIQYVETVIECWNKPDHSIWEVRGKDRRFIFSAIMCWVALDRAIKIAEKHSFPYDILKWHNVRNEIYKEVHEKFWSEEKQAFTQFLGSQNLDASVLLMVILNMTSPSSEKWIKTMKAIDKELRSDVLLYRYREKAQEIDGLAGQEGTFTMCSFWHVECLALSGQVEKAKEHFEKMLGYANHLGLFGEQLGHKGEFLGNFPQAFTHLALISAAIEMNKAEAEPSNTASPFVKKAK